MKKLCFLVMAIAITALGCTKSSTPSAPSTPIQVVGCSVESVVTTAAATAVAAADGCTNISQIQSDIQAALGSANICAAAGVQAQLSKLAQKDPVKLKGIVGGVVCPIVTDAIATLIGSKVPASWGCTGSSPVGAAISSACVAVVPF